MSKIKEKFLLNLIQSKHDAEAYGQIYDLYINQIFRFILFKVATVEEAEDITSEVFLKTWQYITTNKKKVKNIKALFYQIARNCVIDYYRSKSKATLVTDEEVLLNIKEERTDSSVKDLDVKIEIKQIENYLKQLKEEYREVIVLRYIEDFSVAEIAKILDKSKGNIRVLVHRAIQALRALME